jgi:hypothetical protein
MSNPPSIRVWLFSTAPKELQAKVVGAEPTDWLIEAAPDLADEELSELLRAFKGLRSRIELDDGGSLLLFEDNDFAATRSRSRSNADTYNNKGV